MMDISYVILNVSLSYVSHNMKQQKKWMGGSNILMENVIEW